MQIGELAAAVGVNPKTIRYYEDIGLLPEPERTAAGYRQYQTEDADRLRFIRRAQDLDLSLNEISEILDLRERSLRPCEYVLDIARQRVDQLDRRIAELHQARDELGAVLSRAGELDENTDCYCQLIEHRSGGQPR